MYQFTAIHIIHVYLNTKIDWRLQLVYIGKIFMKPDICRGWGGGCDIQVKHTDSVLNGMRGSYNNPESYDPPPPPPATVHLPPHVEI